MKKNCFILCLILTFFVPIDGTEAASYPRLIKKGNRYFKNELYGDALTYFLQGRVRNNKAIEPIFNSGATYYKMEDYIKSIESFSEVLQKEKLGVKEADVYFNIGNTYFKLGDYMNAVNSYTKALEINPSDLNLKYNLELALKKLKEKEQKQNSDKNQKQGQNREDNKNKSTDSKNEPGDKEKESQKNDEQAKQTPPEPSDKRDLSREEAERLLRSLNTEQSQTIGEIIKQRINRNAHEKDW